MQLALPGRPHLTYCTNIHAGESWPEIEAALEQLSARDQARAISPDAPMGVGLAAVGDCRSGACGEPPLASA